MKVTSIIFSAVAILTATVAAGPVASPEALAAHVWARTEDLQSRQSCCGAAQCSRGGCFVSVHRMEDYIHERILTRYRNPESAAAKLFALARRRRVTTQHH